MASQEQNKVLNSSWLCTLTRGDIEFEWTIEEFHLLPHKNGEDIYSPAFPNNCQEQWKLRIYPLGYKAENDGWISVYLWPTSDKMLGIEEKYEISILRLKETLQTSEVTHKFEKLEGCGSPRLIERSKLSVQNDSKNAITFRCKIKTLGTYTISSSEEECLDRAVTFEVRKNGLSRDFKSLYRNPTLTDFTVISGDKTYPAHKLILASRSPVFAAMFQHKEVDENVENEVKIENMEPAVVGKLLEFIYTDDVSEIGELADGLLAAAEQYGLDDLKNMCEETLYKTLNENNAAELLALADLHNATQLKKYAMQYITAHPEIVHLKSFDSVELPSQLFREIIRAALPKASVNDRAK